MCSLTGSTIICCRSLFKLAVWCCPLPQPPRIIHCWCLNLPFQCWWSFNSYPRLCVSICYIVKLSIDILWFSFHGRAINQYNSIFTVPQSQGDPNFVYPDLFGHKGSHKKNCFFLLFVKKLRPPPLPLFWPPQFFLIRIFWIGPDPPPLFGEKW